MIDLKKLMLREIDAINKLLRAHKVDAGTMPKMTLVAGSSFIAYGVKLGRSETIASVESRLPEITERISAIRGMRSVVRLRRTPLALEVPPPHPRVLDWGGAPMHMPAHYMLVGRTYDYSGSGDIVVTLDDVPHVLVAGITGAGKSVLVAMVLSTLLLNTSPQDLRVVLVDLKNEDLQPFATMPHVLTFAGTPDAAMQAIEYVHSVKDRRVEAGRGDHAHRLLLVIDELAELAQVSGALDLLGSILSIGRSKRINVIAATQKPTAAVVGSIAKANFTMRLVGQVADATEASTATGRKQTGAEMLPGRGAFLRIQGPEIERFQSYYIAPEELDRLCGQIAQKWGNSVDMQPDTDLIRLDTGLDMTRYIDSIQVDTRGENSENDFPEKNIKSRIVFPLGEARPLSEREAEAVRMLADHESFQWRGELSISRLTKYVYGSRNPERDQWVRDALGSDDDGKVIRLRRGA